MNFQIIQEKREKLKQIQTELKKEFVGIDYIIGKLIKSIEIWYLMPEVLVRPIIINLWGMTGVGKTDLIRSLMKKLDFLDRFLEIELKHNSYRGSIFDKLMDEKFGDGNPCAVLFDEIQKFATKDTEGKDVADQSFSDFWELLSDGKLSRKESRDILSRNIFKMLFNNKKRKNKMEKNPGSEIDEELDEWEVQDYAEIFGISAESLLDLDKKDISNNMENLQKSKKFYEAVDYSKLLIFISGNLDSAYSMSTNTGESDIDADIFYAYTSKINIVDIKKALSKLFKPEQVARFGNQHLIYKSLSKLDFQNLITHSINKIIQRNREMFEVNLQIDKSINHLIYQNGVFPAQGVRPVFSTIGDILESNLPRFIFEALISSSSDIFISYKHKQIVAELTSQNNQNNQKIVVDFVGALDKIKQDNSPSLTYNISIHEAGHCVVYAILTGLAPLQLKSKVASSSAGGFVFPHQMIQTKQSILDKIKILAAGGLAEELFFGEDLATIGRSTDREKMTTMAVDFVRYYGFGKREAIYDKNNLDPKTTDLEIEELVVEQVAITKQILKENQKAIKNLADKLFEKETLSPVEIVKILAKHKIIVEIKDENYVICPDYKK